KRRPRERRASASRDLVPPTEAQVVERETLQPGELRFETCTDRAGLVRDGRNSWLWATPLRRLDWARARCRVHSPPSPFRWSLTIDDGICARALIFAPTPIDL